MWLTLYFTRVENQHLKQLLKLNDALFLKTYKTCSHLLRYRKIFVVLLKYNIELIISRKIDPISAN